MNTPDLTSISDSESGGAPPPPAQDYKVVVPAAEPVVWPKKKSDGKPFKMTLPPQKVWEYRLADGALFGVTARWDLDPPMKDGTTKMVLPCVYAEIEGEARWAWLGFGAADGSRPLLGLMELGAKPLATVLVVEGEKTRDAAARYLPESWVCVTWQGGGKATLKTDWLPLAGRRVVLWMDKDAPPRDKATGEVRLDPTTKAPLPPPGEATGLELFKMLTTIGAGAGMVPVYGPRMSMIPNNGWDLADTLPDGLDPREWMERVAQMVSIPAQKTEPSRTEAGPGGRPQLVVDNSGDKNWKEPPTKRSSGFDDKAEYRAVGYSQDGGKPVFHFHSARSGFILTIGGKDLLSASGAYLIVNNDNFWRARFDFPRESYEKVPWRIVGAKLMDECYESGYFEIEKERGRGAWLDDDRVVMHLGQTLIVDGRVINPTKMVSEFYYPTKHKLIKIKGTAPLSDAEGKLIRQISRAIAWKNPFLAELFCGWIATAMVCGAMPWRTHFWLQGPAGSGKTWIVDNVVKPCFGDIAFKPMGNSSAAGINATLERDARPVVFDEAEAKGSHGEERRQMVVELMRYSSSQSDGEVVKGTASHGRVGFAAKAQFFMASIGVGITEQADITRTVVAQILTRPPEDGTFETLKSLVKQLPKDLPEKLLRRQLTQLRTIRQNAESFASVISLQLGNRRMGDMIGTLMAGDHSLFSDRVLTFDEVEDRIADRLTDKRFIDFARVKDSAEDIDLLRHMVSWTIQVQGRGNVRYDRPIGEVLYIAMGKQQDDKIEVAEADDGLRRIGIKREKMDGVPGFWIARQKSYIATRVMAASTYSQGWDRILATLPGAVESQGDCSFAGVKLPGLWLPFDVLVMAEAAAMPDVSPAPDDALL